RHVLEAMRTANRGRKHTDEARAKMSAAQRARGARPPKAGVPWTAREDALLRRLPAEEVAQRTGRTLRAAYSRRRDLGLPGGRRRGWGAARGGGGGPRASGAPAPPPAPAPSTSAAGAPRPPRTAAGGRRGGQGPWPPPGHRRPPSGSPRRYSSASATPTTSAN